MFEPTELSNRSAIAPQIPHLLHLSLADADAIAVDASVV